MKKLVQEQIRLKRSKERRKQLYQAKEWYTIRAILGNQ